MANELFNEVIVLFLLSILVNLACSRLKLPATVGFLLTGVLCGPSMLGLVSDEKTIENVADLGVAMLMFTIGMELSGDALNRLKRPVFLGGSLQIGLVVLFCWGAGLFIGKPEEGVLWGMLMALSSSAIVLQIFQSKGMASSPVGRLGLAILVFQDIMVAPMMIMVPLLAGTVQLTWEEGLLSAAKVAGLGLGMILFSRFLLDRLMNAVVRTRAREVLLLTTLVICFGFARLTTVLGMSASLGSFLAGLMLARSQYSMSVIADILPYRHVFMSLFFISVGMLLNVGFVASNAGLILGLVAAFILLKTLISMPAVLVQGYPLYTAVSASLCLAQAGEFAFVLAAAAQELGFLHADHYQVFLAVSVISMMATPGIIAVSGKAGKAFSALARWLGLPVAAPDAESVAHTAGGLSDHIIIVGFGFSGKHLARTAKECRLPYTILEMNPETVARYSQREPISYGDASEPSILDALGIAKARVIAIVISDLAAVRAIVAKARQANPQVVIIARTRFVTEIGPLHSLGANYVIAEEFESAIEVFSQVLSTYLVPRQDIEAMADHVRRQNYRMVRRIAHTSEGLASLVDRLPEMGVQALRLEEQSGLAGKTLAESRMRPLHAVTLVAVYRNGQIHPSPDGQFQLKAGDVLYVFGSSDRLYAFKTALAGGKAETGRGTPLTV